MEIDFNLSVRLFSGEILLFVMAGAAWYGASKSGLKSRLWTRVAWALLALTGAAAAAALVFPVRFVLEHASGLRNAHPLVLGILAGAPAMPLALLAFPLLRRRR